jgi:hypothetical protein
MKNLVSSSLAKEETPTLSIQPLTHQQDQESEKLVTEESLSDESIESTEIFISQESKIDHQENLNTADHSFNDSSDIINEDIKVVEPEITVTKERKKNR